MTRGVAARRRAPAGPPRWTRPQLDALERLLAGARARPAGCTRAGGRAGNRQDTPPFGAGGSCRGAQAWFFRGRRRSSSAGCRFRSLCMHWTNTSGSLDPNLLSTLDGDVEAELAHVLPSLSALAAGRAWRSSTSAIGAIERCARCSSSLRRGAARARARRLPLGRPASVELLGALLRRPPGAAVLTAVALRPRQTPSVLRQRSSGRIVRRR